MEHKEIYDLLKTLGIPVAYNHFDVSQNAVHMTNQMKYGMKMKKYIIIFMKYST